MITLTSEFTDGKGRHARAWVFFDAECGFCTRLARRVAPLLATRGIALAKLQDPRVSKLLGLPLSELLREIRYLNVDAKQFSGADAFVAVAREFWWGRSVRLVQQNSRRNENFACRIQVRRFPTPECNGVRCEIASAVPLLSNRPTGARESRK